MLLFPSRSQLNDRCFYYSFTIIPFLCYYLCKLYQRTQQVCLSDNNQIQVCLTELYSHPTQKSRFPHKLPLPAHICNCSYNGGSGIFIPILSVFAPLLKSRFFVISYRYVTLTDGPKPPLCKGSLFGEPLVAIGGHIWYNTPKERKVFGMIKVLFVCHGRISPDSEKSLCL